MSELWIIDAFTTTPFKGNSAAVCILDHFPDDATLGRIAMEMNLSETAFLVEKSPLYYYLRWFTPIVEVNLCGHATLAATHRLLESGVIHSGDTVVYDTQSGILTASVKDSTITLDFPVLAGIPAAPHTSLKALGVPILACEHNRDNYLVEVADFETLQSCVPDFNALLAMDMQGVIVTTATGVPQNYDFASRYFATPCGINEDPVTGSAHCFLAPYWAKKLGKTRFKALQSSTREGTLLVELTQDRVLISGSCITTLKGHLTLLQTSLKERAA